MAFYGDQGGVGIAVPFGKRIAIPMSTSIVRIHAAFGFLVAADGRKYDERKQRVISDTATKIFQLEAKDYCLAYSLAGTVGLGPDEDESITFRFDEAVAQAVHALRKVRAITLREFADNVGRSLCETLKAAKRDGKIGTLEGEPLPQNPERQKVAEIFWDGYFLGKEERANLTISHRQGRSLKFHTEPVSLNALVLYGRPEVVRRIIDNDPCFGQYHREPNGSLANAIEVAEQCLLACSSQIARDIDPESITTGPRIHMATITRSGGFDYVDGFHPGTECPVDPAALI
jgi:hypothetical protein